MENTPCYSPYELLDASLARFFVRMTRMHSPKNRMSRTTDKRAVVYHHKVASKRGPRLRPVLKMLSREMKRRKRLTNVRLIIYQRGHIDVAEAMQEMYTISSSTTVYNRTMLCVHM